MHLVRCNKCKAEIPGNDKHALVVFYRGDGSLPDQVSSYRSINLGNHLCMACCAEMQTIYGLDWAFKESSHG